MLITPGSIFSFTWLEKCNKMDNIGKNGYKTGFIPESIRGFVKI
jgi:hypothetical protein